VLYCLTPWRGRKDAHSNSKRFYFLVNGQQRYIKTKYEKIKRKGIDGGYKVRVQGVFKWDPNLKS